jgi:hypothetical protein
MPHEKSPQEKSTDASNRAAKLAICPGKTGEK